MRMLERGFGPNSSKGKGKAQGNFVDENGRLLIGTIDVNGNLDPQGPKKRVARRIFQIFFALGAGVPVTYAAVVLKPNPPAFVLHILSVVISLTLLYLLFPPCCCNPRRKNKASSEKEEKGKKPKKCGEGLADRGDGGAQMNLIVNPDVLYDGQDDEDSDDDGTDVQSGHGDGGVPGGYYGIGYGNARGNVNGRRN